MTLRIGIHGPMRRIFLLLGVILGSTVRANATPIEIVSGTLGASEFTAWDTGISITLSDGRLFSAVAPFMNVTPTGLDQTENTVRIPIWSAAYPWGATFHFFHEPMTRPNPPDGESLVPFTMTGTLTTCSAVRPPSGSPPQGPQCFDQNTEDVTGHGTITWSIQPLFGFPYQVVQYSFVPESSSSLVLLGIGVAALISWKKCLLPASKA
jgi:hypothetical protein